MRLIRFEQAHVPIERYDLTLKGQLAEIVQSGTAITAVYQTLISGIITKANNTTECSTLEALYQIKSLAFSDLNDVFAAAESRQSVQAEWQYQRSSAENAVRRIKIVKGVSNMVQLKPHAQSSEIERKIQEAFRRNAEVDSNRIIVEADGSVVTLKGTVRSWIEREEAERAAWAAPGVTSVIDQIAVRP